MSIFGILAQLSPTTLWFGIHMLSDNILEFLLLYISCTFTADTRNSWERGGGAIKGGVPVVLYFHCRYKELLGKRRSDQGRGPSSGFLKPSP